VEAEEIQNNLNEKDNDKAAADKEAADKAAADKEAADKAAADKEAADKAAADKEAADKEAANKAEMYPTVMSKYNKKVIHTGAFD
jgi:hypothetical protein